MHSEFLLAALEQAKNGRGFCSPNPAVGAVAVKDNQIIARAWHEGAGLPHAEQALLKTLPKGLQNITLYVTLEPCNHWGKTPPCVDAIIQYGIKKVVYAHKDPNPVVKANDTPAYLAQHNVEVEHFPMLEVDVFYQSYRYWVETGLPWVTVKLAQSLDGKIAGPSGEQVQLSNDSCRIFTHKQRHQSDIILTTAQTINQDNPQLNVRLPEGVFKKPIAILDKEGRVNHKATVFNTAEKCLIFYDERLGEKKSGQLLSYFPTPSNKSGLGLYAILKKLGQLGYHDVWVEAGAKLFHALHRAQLVHQTYLYITPNVLGAEALTGYPQALSFFKPESINWHPMDDNVVLSMSWKVKPTEVEDVCSQV